MSDAGIRIPADARDRLAEALLTPAERAEKARVVRREWNGCDPNDAEQAELDAELDRRMAEAGAVRP
ncbi:hypothetical protein [Streptomyces umbrinus]|uniref:hypothetical protein n=1 Tax=Streptomyces umbrinus TaxID=67370 RepID=UPI003C2DEF08